jgi:hypothetical protein
VISIVSCTVIPFGLAVIYIGLNGQTPLDQVTCSIMDLDYSNA